MMPTATMATTGRFSSRMIACIGLHGMRRRDGGTGETHLDPEDIVERGYDAIASRYLEWSDIDPSPVRLWFLGEVLTRVPEGADVLELGSGAGVPVGAALAEGRRYRGVDISGAQVALARERVPGGTFLKADFTALAIPDSSLDAVVSFYAFNHVPLADQAATVTSIAGWLRPGGVFCATLAGGGNTFEETEPDWLGAPMFFVGQTLEDDRRMLEGAGLEIELSEIREEEEEGHGTVSFHWAITRKPRPPGA
jgi:SAM-dependent methyltransferase